MSNSTEVLHMLPPPSHTSSTHTLTLLKASTFASIKHKHQLRKDGSTPYINHPLGVAYILTKYGKIEDTVTLVAAILHDTVEDTDTSFEELTNEFGQTVSALVKEVTDDKTLSKAERKALQIQHTPLISPKAKLIKLADKIYNLQDILRIPPLGWTQERVDEYFAWSRKVTDAARGLNSGLDAVLDEVFRKYENGKKGDDLHLN